MPARMEPTQVERDKVEINPNFDFRDIAQRPFTDLTTNEIGMFKWSGVYHQLQKGFFMIRLRVPGGVLTAAQVRRAGDLADAYGQGLLCITTRQCLQFHWVRQEDLYKIIEGMQEVGVLTQNACGDVTRNVVTCPLQGVCPHEVTDRVGDVLRQVADHPELLYDQRNLPRKHKISINGCGRACGQTLMNCQSWYPIRRPAAAGEEVGWSYWAGGGLGARPRLAKEIFSWVPEDLVAPVTCAATEVFRRHGDRRKRIYSRLKFVVERFGAAGFGDLVLDVLRERGTPGLERIERTIGAARVGPSFLDNQPVIAQKQPGHSTVRVLVRRSEFTGAEARRFADLAETYGDGSLMFTNRQNLQLRFVPDGRVGELVATLRAAGYDLDSHERLPDAVACVGTTMCNLAVADTPNTHRQIVDELGKDQDWWQRIGPLRINMNGCPNSCAQHAVSDIGLRGSRRTEETGSEESYSVFVGGSLAGLGHVAEYVCDVACADIVPLLRRLLDLYLEQRRDDGDPFGDWARRLGGDGVRHALALAEAGREQPIAIRNLALRELLAEVVLAADGEGHGHHGHGSGFAEA